MQSQIVAFWMLFEPWLARNGSARHCVQLTNPEQTDIPLQPDVSLPSRVLHWLTCNEQPVDSQLKHTKPLSSIFPDGPYPAGSLQPMRRVCSTSCLQLYLADAGSPGSVLEIIDGLGGPYDMYKI
jgi:hypothetical protein